MNIKGFFQEYGHKFNINKILDDDKEDLGSHDANVVIRGHGQKIILPILGDMTISIIRAT